MALIVKLTRDEFLHLSPDQQKNYVELIRAEFLRKQKAEHRLSRANGRNGSSALIWLEIQAIEPISQALAQLLKEEGLLKIDFRGSPCAWLLGTHTDLGYYDGIKKAAQWLTDTYGVSCKVCDAADDDA